MKKAIDGYQEDLELGSPRQDIVRLEMEHQEMRERDPTSTDQFVWRYKVIRVEEPSEKLWTESERPLAASAHHGERAGLVGLLFISLVFLLSLVLKDGAVIAASESFQGVFISNRVNWFGII